MKQIKFYIISALLSCFLVNNIAAQAPDVISYQGVALDSEGTIITNSDITIQFDIRQTSLNGTSVYQESHIVNVNSMGQFSALIGTGDNSNGQFESIDWSSGLYFLNVGLDVNMMGSFVDAGTVQLVSVPYALIAEHTLNAPEGQGRQGIPGEVGSTGPSGPSGPSGPQGESGFQGTQCPVTFGLPGIQGPEGPQGPQGTQGPGGGPQGPEGDKGPQGDQGSDIGPQGIKGPQGEQGQKGPQGPQGPQGPRGPNGPSDGPQGPEGPQGVRGPGGGPQGPAGDTGLIGEDGQEGAVGPSGPTGFAGLYTLEMTNIVPDNTTNQNIYLDDGSNRTDGRPGFRFFNGTIWIDLNL